jgi:hypothetical protein
MATNLIYILFFLFFLFFFIDTRERKRALQTRKEEGKFGGRGNGGFKQGQRVQEASYFYLSSLFVLVFFLFSLSHLRYGGPKSGITCFFFFFSTNQVE